MTVEITLEYIVHGTFASGFGTNFFTFHHAENMIIYVLKEDLPLSRLTSIRKGVPFDCFILVLYQ